MIKILIMLFLFFLISLSLGGVVELIAFNRVRILVVSEIVNLGTWFLISEEKEKAKS